MRALIPNSTQIPDVILDHWMARLSGAEFKVVLYIARRTYGFGKESDTISLNQLSKGIRRRDGQQLDHGTGLSRAAVKNACSSLVAKGILIKTQATVSGSREADQNTYRLNLYAPIEDDEPQGPEGGEEEDLGSNEEVGQNLAHVGRKVAHLESAPKTSSEVGQNLAHVGQKKAYVGQPVAHGGPETSRGVGQKIAPQETDQETEIQETATTAPTEPAAGIQVAAAELSPSALVSEEQSLGTELLQAAGFSFRDASLLASQHPLSVIREQLGWLELRSARRNRLGMLRKAIEERWPKPETDEEVKKREAAKEQTARRSAQEARRAEIAGSLRAMYSRLESDAPEAFTALQEHIEELKAKEAQRPLISANPKRIEMMQQAYDREERRIALMVDFFSRTGAPLPEFEPLLASLSGPSSPPIEQLFAS